MLRSSRYFVPYLNALAASLVYGSWAIFANFEHGRAAWLMAGLIQGAYAFGSTLSVTVVARWVYRRAGSGIRGVLAGFGLSFLVMMLFPVVIHSVAGTPDIIQTISPGLFLGSGYLISYLIIAYRKDKTKDEK